MLLHIAFPLYISLDRGRGGGVKLWDFFLEKIIKIRFPPYCFAMSYFFFLPTNKKSDRVENTRFFFIYFLFFNRQEFSRFRRSKENTMTWVGR